MISEDDFSFAQLGLSPDQLRQLERLGWIVEDTDLHEPETSSG